MLLSLHFLVPKGKNCLSWLQLPTERGPGSTYSLPAGEGRTRGVFLLFREEGRGRSLQRKAWAGSRPRGAIRRAGCGPGGNALPLGGADSTAAAHKPGCQNRCLGPHRGVLSGLKGPCVLSLPGRGGLASPPPRSQNTHAWAHQGHPATPTRWTHRRGHPFCWGDALALLCTPGLAGLSPAPVTTVMAPLSGLVWVFSSALGGRIILQPRTEPRP